MSDMEGIERFSPDGDVWIGDMAGFEVSATDNGQIVLHHRCGWAETQRASGIQADFSVYVGNLMEPLLRHRAEGCKRHELSPDLAEMMTRLQRERHSG